jgi:hypothetical protein
MSSTLKVIITSETRGYVRGLRTAGNESDKFGKRVEAVSKKASLNLGGLAKRAAGLGAAFLSIKGAKDAVGATETLAKSTLTLSKSFGLATHEASQWAAVAQARGTDGKALTMGFKALSTAVHNASEGSKQQVKTFRELGISHKALAANGNDLHWVLRQVSDGLAKMPAGTEKSALSAKLFGRTWTSIAPLIREGSDAMDKQLQVADKYGATFTDKGAKGLQDFIKAQRESKLATLGLQVAFGTQVAPALTKGITAVSGFVAQMRNGEGVGGRFVAVAGRLVTVVKGGVTEVQAIVGWFQRGNTAAVVLTVALGALTAGVVTYRAATVVAAVSTAGMGTAMVGLGTAIAVVSTAATDARAPMLALALIVQANPFVATATAVIALGTALVITYKKSETFRNVVKGVFHAVEVAIGASGAFILRTLDKILGGMSSMLGVASGIPGIGGKFKSAQHGIDDARESLRSTADQLDRIGKKKDQTISIKVKFRGDTIDIGKIATGPKYQLSATPSGRRRGGVIGRYSDGGMVPALVSPGEQLVYGNQSATVPGARTAADNVFTYLPVGTAVLTDSGQGLMAQGASLGQALAMQAPHFAAGGIVKGRVSTFGPPGEGAGKTASGVSSSTPGIALNLKPGTDAGWDNATTNRWVRDRQAFTVSIGGHRGVLPVIDKGPAGRTGRAIDVTGAGARRLGLDPARFPTDSIGTAAIAGAHTSTSTGRSTVALGARYLADARTAGFTAGLEGARRVSGSLLRDLISGSIGTRRTAVTSTASPGSSSSVSGVPTWKRGQNTLQWARRFAKTFGLRVTSGYRTPAHNAAVGGVPNSLHTHGSASDPGAIDFVPPSAAALAAVKKAGFAKEAMIHDAGSGRHLHVGLFRRGGTVGRFRAGGLANAVNATLKPGATDAGDTARAFAKLAAVLADITRTNYSTLSKLITTSTARAAAERRAGNSVAARRLDAVVNLAQAQQGIRLARPIVNAQNRIAAGDSAVTRLGLQQRIVGVASDSITGLQQLQGTLGEQVGTLTASRKDLERALARAKRAKNSKAVKEISDALGSLDDTILDRRASLADLQRQIAEASIAQRYDRFNERITGAKTAQIIAQVDTPNDLSDDLRGLQGELAAATDAYQLARQTGDAAGIEQFGSEILGLRGSIDQLTSTITDTGQQNQALTDALNAHADQLARLARLGETEPDNLWAAAIAALNGGIGEAVTRGRQTPMFAGFGARY